MMMADPEQQTQQQTTVKAEQVRMAAASGVRLLDDKDLKVPMDIAIDGSLSILRMLLVSVANGQLIFSSPPKADQTTSLANGDKSDA